MRRPFHLFPSLPIYLLLLWNSHIYAVVKAEPIAEGAEYQRVAEEAGKQQDWNLEKLPEARQNIFERDLADGLIERNPLPLPVAKAKPVPQGNYNAYSGAVYIVGGNGQALNAASPAYCPAQAPQGCGNIGVWNWCCPAGNSCAWTDSTHSVVGCCPNGGSCSGSVDRSQITTVYITTTQYQAKPTVVAVNGAQAPTTTVIAGGGPYVGQATKTVKYNGYCTTIYAQGANFPTTANAYCGTALVLNEGVRLPAREVLGSISAFWLALGILWVGLQVRR